MVSSCFYLFLWKIIRETQKRMEIVWSYCNTSSNFSPRAIESPGAGFCEAILPLPEKATLIWVDDNRARASLKERPIRFGIVKCSSSCHVIS